MIYSQRTWAVVNDEDIRYLISNGILKASIYSEKKYIWSDEELTTENMEFSGEGFAKYIKKTNFKYWKVKKKLFKGKEYLEFNDHWDTRNTWDLDKIEKVTVQFEWAKEDMTMGEAEERLDVEEYAKMMKGLGLNSLE
jgi:hypothetical protein